MTVSASSVAGSGASPSWHWPASWWWRCGASSPRDCCPPMQFSRHRAGTSSDTGGRVRGRTGWPVTGPNLGLTYRRERRVLPITVSLRSHAGLGSGLPRRPTGYEVMVARATLERRDRPVTRHCLAKLTDHLHHLTTENPYEVR